MTYIGVDLGTSAVKMVLMDEAGTILKIVSREYPLSFPKQGWSEQEPDDWWAGVLSGMRELLEGQNAREVAGISFGGQMHGLVMLDENDRVIRPAILWNDNRTTAETDYLNQVIGKKMLSAYTANIAFAGFTAPKLLWVRKNEPEHFAKIRKIMLPKDYIAYRMTGVHATDYSDASGLLLLDVEHKRWSQEMLAICGVTEDMLPQLFESYAPIGTLKKELAEAWGLSPNVLVAAGAGDNAAAAVGTGTVGEGTCNISLGTSGTIFIPSAEFRVDPYNALHSFDHADGSYHLMGVELSAASCLKWWMEDILHSEDYNGEQADISRLGENNVFFLPYLMGERSPHNDSYARGTFIGLSMNTSRSEMVQAIMEGVAFGLRDSYDIAKSLGIHVERTKICGGGAKSPLWRKMIANIFNIPVEVPACEEGPGYGAAILAAVACGEFASVEEACEKLIHVVNIVLPEPELVAKYEEKYRKFHALYPALKPVFRELAE